MSKCFVTKFPSEVNANPNLQTLGSMRIIRMAEGEDYAKAHMSNGNDSDNSKIFKCYDKDGNYLYTVGHQDMPNEVAYIDVLDKYKWVGPKYLGTMLFVKDTAEFRHCKKLIYIPYIIEGDIANFKDCTSVKEAFISRSGANNYQYFGNIFGDISVFANMPNLTTLSVNDTNVSGDVSSLSTLTNLTSLSVNGTNISGDISSLSTLTNLTNLAVNGTNISGDVSSLSTLTNLTNLAVDGTNVSGDIGTLLVNNLTKITYVKYSPSKQSMTDEQKTALTNRGCTIIAA